MNAIYVLADLLRVVFCVLVAYLLPHRVLAIKAVLILWVSNLFSYYPALWMMGDGFDPTLFKMTNTVTDQIINFSFLRWLTRFTRRSSRHVASNLRVMKLLLVVLWISLVIRITGTILFIVKRKREYLVYLPNFVGDLLLLFCVFMNYKTPVFLMVSVVFLYLVIKIILVVPMIQMHPVL